MQKVNIDISDNINFKWLIWLIIILQKKTYIQCYFYFIFSSMNIFEGNLWWVLCVKFIKHIFWLNVTAESGDLEHKCVLLKSNLEDRGNMPEGWRIRVGRMEDTWRNDGFRNIRLKYTINNLAFSLRIGEDYIGIKVYKIHKKIYLRWKNLLKYSIKL